METNPLGRQIGELFGTIAWLWVFHRFSQDGAVLLGYQHPWEHGEHGHDAGQIDMKPSASHEQVTASWEKFSTTSIIPGDDDDVSRHQNPGLPWFALNLLSLMLFLMIP